MRIMEDGTGKFAIYEDGQIVGHLDKCSRCHHPVARQVAMPLRLAGVQQQADMLGPDGLLCIDCLEKEIESWDKEGLR